MIILCKIFAKMCIDIYMFFNIFEIYKKCLIL